MTKARRLPKTGWDDLANWAPDFGWSTSALQAFGRLKLPEPLVKDLAAIVETEKWQQDRDFPTSEEQMAALEPVARRARQLRRALGEMDQLSAERLAAHLHLVAPDLLLVLHKDLPNLEAAVARALKSIKSGPGRPATRQQAIARKVCDAFLHHGMKPRGGTGSKAPAVHAILLEAIGGFPPRSTTAPVADIRAALKGATIARTKG
jgi:hypothetical protein